MLRLPIDSTSAKLMYPNAKEAGQANSGLGSVAKLPCNIEIYCRREGLAARGYFIPGGASQRGGG